VGEQVRLRPPHDLHVVEQRDEAVAGRVHAELPGARAEVHVRHLSPARDLPLVGDPQQPPGVFPKSPVPASACTPPLSHTPAYKARADAEPTSPRCPAASPDGRFRANIPPYG